MEDITLESGPLMMMMMMMEPRHSETQTGTWGQVSGEGKRRRTERRGGQRRGQSNKQQQNKMNVVCCREKTWTHKVEMLVKRTVVSEYKGSIWHYFLRYYAYILIITITTDYMSSNLSNRRGCFSNLAYKTLFFVYVLNTATTVPICLSPCVPVIITVTTTMLPRQAI